MLKDKVDLLLSPFIKRIKNLPSFVRLFLPLFLLFLTLFLIFPASNLSTFSSIEKSAAYVTDVLKKNDIDYIPLMVEQKDKDHPVPNTYSEFHTLYGVFKESNITYVGSVNGDKTKQIYVEGYSEFSNLSFIYAEYFSNVEYNGHFKHQYYPLELMFKGNHNTFDTGAFSFCYISKTQADALISSRYFGLEVEEYEDLINKILLINFGDDVYKYLISNIYLEQNYFYDGLTDAFGSFLVGYNKYPEGFNLQSSYFLRKYKFQNMFYMNRANSSFNSKYYEIKIGNNNFAFSKTKALAFYNNSHYFLDVLLVFIILAIIALSSYFTLCYLSLIYDKKTYFYFLLLIPVLLSYLISFLVYLVTSNLFFFTFVSCVVFSMYLVAFIIFSIFILSRRAIRL